MRSPCAPPDAAYALQRHVFDEEPQNFSSLFRLLVPMLWRPYRESPLASFALMRIRAKPLADLTRGRRRHQLQPAPHRQGYGQPK